MKFKKLIFPLILLLIIIIGVTYSITSKQQKADDDFLMHYIYSKSGTTTNSKLILDNYFKDKETYDKYLKKISEKDNKKNNNTNLYDKLIGELKDYESHLNNIKNDQEYTTFNNSFLNVLNTVKENHLKILKKDDSLSDKKNYKEVIKECQKKSSDFKKAQTELIKKIEKKSKDYKFSDEEFKKLKEKRKIEFLKKHILNKVILEVKSSVLSKNI